MLSFKNQIVLITGASRGVGAAAAIRFAEAGATGIVINYKTNRNAAMVVAESVERIGAKALPVQADVSLADETKSLVKQTLENFGRLDVVVASAGIWPVEDRSIIELDEAQWSETMRINVNGIVHGHHF